MTAGLQAKLGIDITIYELCVCVCVCFFPHGATDPCEPRTPRYQGFKTTHTHTHTHKHTHNHSVGLIWKSDQPVEATSTGQQTTLTRKIFQIRTCNPNKQAAADPCLRPRRHWDRYVCINVCTHEHIMRMQV